MASYIPDVSLKNNNSFASTALKNNTLSASEQKNEFLQLLTYQLKNQNPTAPYNNQEFAAQLATFSQLEQLTSIKQLLNNQADLFGTLAMSIENTAIPGMIGKYAKAITNQIKLDGTDGAVIRFENKFNATSGKLVIKNSLGNIVRTIELNHSDCMTGEHAVQWDGKDDDGHNLPADNYFISTELSDASGGSVNSNPFVIGKISSVKFKQEGTMLIVGGVEISLDRISDVRESAF